MCFLRFSIARIRKAICVEIARYLSIHGSSRVAKNMERCFKNFTVIFISLWPNLAKSFSVDGCHFLAMTQNCPKKSRQLSPMKGAWLFFVAFFLGLFGKIEHWVRKGGARSSSPRIRRKGKQQPRHLLLLLPPPSLLIPVVAAEAGPPRIQIVSKSSSLLAKNKRSLVD